MSLATNQTDLAATVATFKRANISSTPETIFLRRLVSRLRVDADLLAATPAGLPDRVIARLPAILRVDFSGLPPDATSATPYLNALANDLSDAIGNWFRRALPDLTEEICFDRLAICIALPAPHLGIKANFFRKDIVF